ncbi:hypothetical protein K2173_025934 [Erythroxylum novogranatense]|uniref:Protein kinase domain-containing protein n=1 Tax=Erythroxylum novogranatense TaxID=1862640 RepID=A0AAV8SIB6_9ROSI|nr:hypothetical protein K2173_025934 [Erythroxylum novogranatense]
MQILRELHSQYHFPIKTHLSLFLFIFFAGLPILTVAGDLTAETYTPADNILLNCGASRNSTGRDGREWMGDDGSKFISMGESNKPRAVSKPFDPQSTLDPVPYKTAMLFRSQLTYAFRVSPGQKFIRLWFRPAMYEGLDMSDATFSVTVGPFAILSNFSPSLTANSLRTESFVKEFLMSVEKNQILNISFSPANSSSSIDAYGFINGIEIVSMPIDLYYSASGEMGVTFINRERDRFTIENNTALETVHRLNVGGSSIFPTSDSGMFRSWLQDSKFVLSGGVVLVNKTTPVIYTKIHAYVAPREVYQTARSIDSGMNLTWRLPVDPGFRYFVRLHFCEIQGTMKKSGARKFKVLISNRTAETSVDLIDWAGGSGIPVFKDYVVKMPKAKASTNIYLSITLQPVGTSEPILSGIEVLKVNDTKGNLSSRNAEQFLYADPVPKHHAKKGSTEVTAIVVGVVFMALLFVGLASFWFCKRQDCTVQTMKPMEKGTCHQFTFEDIKNATNDFDKELIIGNGGFGRVYKGQMGDENRPVAIKISKQTSSQGPKEFWAEIEMLSKLRHHHLVSLIGYCDDARLLILVYDYMPHGSLCDHLYQKGNPPLSWKQRLEICIGAARGIEYLHAGSDHIVIHRDVKTSNILLDDKWVPKVSDFGLSRLGPTSLSRSHVTTDVKGTFGFMDPEYFHTNHLSDKSDVFSFGVVMLEVLCARPAVDMELEDQEHSLVLWARQHVKDGTVDRIIDPNLRGQISPKCLKVYVRTAMKCLRDHRKERPTMSQVLMKLECAMKLQEGPYDGADEEGITADDGDQSEQISLCGKGKYRVVARTGYSRDPPHSWPSVWQKATTGKEVNRHFSEGGRGNFSKPISLRGLKAFFFAISAYKALKRDKEESTSGDSTSSKELIEIRNAGDQSGSQEI